MLNIVSMAGSGTAAVGAFRLIVAPAALPLPPVGKNVPLSVADNVPVTFGDSEPDPRKLNRAGFILPAMKLAEKADWPGAPPVSRVRLAFWKLPVNSATMPDPRSPITVTEPPGLKMTRLGRTVEALAVVQPIIPLVIPVFRGPEFNCVEVRRDESVNTGDEPASDQLELEDVFELNEIVSANAAIGLINNTKRQIRITLRIRVPSPALSCLHVMQFIFQIGSKSISYVFIRLEIADKSNRLHRDKKLHDLDVRFSNP
jgi:hypothetical protein